MHDRIDSRCKMRMQAKILTIQHNLHRLSNMKTHASAALARIIAASNGTLLEWAAKLQIDHTMLSRIRAGRTTLTWDRVVAICEQIDDAQATMLATAWLRDRIPPSMAGKIDIIACAGDAAEDPAEFAPQSTIDASKLDPMTIDALRQIAEMAHDPDVAEWLIATAQCLRDPH
jgi:hypothetical protein